jgi:hypothetical protein
MDEGFRGRELYEKSPERLFGLEIPAWHYYFAEEK